MLDAAFIFDGAGLTDVVRWFADECVSALRDSGHNVHACVLGGDGGRVRFGDLSADNVGTFIGQSHMPVIVEVDGAQLPQTWNRRVEPVRVHALVAWSAPVRVPNDTRRLWRMDEDGWRPVVRCDEIDYKPSRHDCFVWRGKGSPGPLYDAAARGALVCSTVRDRWTQWIEGAFMYVNDKTEPVEQAVADALDDADEWRRLTRLAREQVEFLTPQRFVASFEEACR